MYTVFATGQECKRGETLNNTRGERFDDIRKGEYRRDPNARYDSGHRFRRQIDRHSRLHISFERTCPSIFELS